MLNARGRFAASAVAPIVYNLAIIGGALLLAPTMGVTGLAIGVVAGSLGHLAGPAAGRCAAIGFRYDAADRRSADPAARKALHADGRRGPSASARARSRSSSRRRWRPTLGVGAVTAFTVAFTLLQIPIGVIGVPLGVVRPARRCRASSRTATIDEYRRPADPRAPLVVFVMLPLAGAGAIVLRAEIVELLFGYGRFDAAAIELTAADAARVPARAGRPRR